MQLGTPSTVGQREHRGGTPGGAAQSGSYPLRNGRKRVRFHQPRTRGRIRSGQLCSKSGREQTQQQMQLLDHLVDDGQHA